MRKICLAIITLFFVVPAFAQSPSGAESRASFQAFVATEFPDNTSGLVTPANLRLGLLTLSNSALFSFSQLGDLPTGPTTLPSGYTYPSAIVTTSLTLPYTAGGGTQCLEINNGGVVEPTGTGCGGSSSGLVVGASPIVSGTSNGIFYDNAAVLGVTNAANNGVLITSGAGAPSIATTLPSGLTIPAPVVTGSFTATGLVTNNDLVSPTISINSMNCTLGGSCTISASTAAITVGTTGILSGSNGYILYNNSGTLGNLPFTGIAGNNVVLSASPSIDSPTFTTAVTATGLITLADLATQATNTVLVNATSGAASPTAQSVSSCSAAGDALNWTTNTGFGCNTSITAAAMPASGITGTTLPVGIVTSSLTTVGTIGTGIWAGTSVALAHGGTNNAITADNGGIIYSDASKLALLASTGTASQCLLSGNHAAPTWGSCSGAAAVSSVSDDGNGTMTISPTTGAVLAAINLGNTNTWTAPQTFTNSDLKLLGSSTGKTTFTSENSGASNYTISFQAGTGVVPFETEVIRGAGGRLSLQTGTPVMSSSQQSTTIYYVTYAGNTVPYYDGTDDHMGPMGGSQMTLALENSGTGLESANNVFDVWYIYNNGTPKICVATNNSGAGWSGDSGGSNTARGSGYSALDYTTRPYPTNSVALSYCYNGATNYPVANSNQATYLGSICTDAATAGQVSYTFGGPASGGMGARLCVWNQFNRVSTSTSSTDSGASYTYSSATIREARGSTGNQIVYLVGQSEDGIVSTRFDTVEFVNSNGVPRLGIGIDTTTAYTCGPATAGIAGVVDGESGETIPCVTNGIGLHTISANENSPNAGAAVFNVLSSASITATIRN